jgi:anion-transporting  ArsA/GET3 family ATPase
VFLTPGGLTARIFGRGTGLVFAIFARVTGIDMFSELSRFFRSLTGVIDGFGERTRGVAALLADPKTAFLIVTSAEREPAREAMFLAERLAQAAMQRGALIVNRVHSDGLGGRSVEDVEALLAPELGEGLARRAAANLADFDLLAKRDERTISGLSSALGERAPILVPHLDQEIDDLFGLSRVAEHLFA